MSVALRPTDELINGKPQRVWPLHKSFYQKRDEVKRGCSGYLQRLHFAFDQLNTLHWTEYSLQEVLFWVLRSALKFD